MMATGSHALTVDGLSRDLNTRRIGRRIIVLPEIDSTNTYVLRKLAPADGSAADGVVVFAEHQTAGRGRMGRSWHSPRGASLMMTVMLWERGLRHRPAYWIMASAVSVVQGIESASDLSPVIRWPNDVYVDRRKLSGILVETQPTADGGNVIALGIGVNCLQQAGHFPPELRQQATSLELASSHPVNRTMVAQAILQALDGWLCDPQAWRDDQLTAAWMEHSGDIGQRVTLLSGTDRFTGHILDVDPVQGLMLQLDSGKRACFDPATTSRL